MERIDILFSDVMMPGGMNGSQLAVEAQQIRPGLKVLLTSGYVADLDEGQVIGRGELPVLSKPYRRDELARSLRLVLGAKWPDGLLHRRADLVFHQDKSFFGVSLNGSRVRNHGAVQGRLPDTDQTARAARSP